MAITTTERFKKIIEDKKKALAALRGEEQLQATAAVVYMEYMFKQQIKKMRNEKIWDEPGLTKVFNTTYENEKFLEDRAEKIDQIKAEVTVLKNRLSLKNPQEPLPEEMFEYAAVPGSITDEQMKTAREKMIKRGVRFNLLVKPEEGMSDTIKETLEKEIRCIPSVNAKNHELRQNYCDTEGTQQNPGIKEKLEKLAKRACLLPDRSNTHAHTFIIYLIAEKGMSYKDACKLIPGHQDFENRFNDFMTFLKNHPVLPLEDGAEPDEDNIAVTPDEAKQNAKTIMDMFNKCGNYFANYRIPDIDYNDVEAIKNVQDEFSGLQDLVQDYGQQMEYFLNRDVQTIKELPEERKQCFNAIAPAYQIVRFAKMFESSYQLDRSSRDLNLFPRNYVRGIALNRILFTEMANSKFKGKTGAELYAEASPYDLYTEELPTLLIGKAPLYDEMTDELVTQYLNGGVGNLPEIVRQKIQEETEELRKGFNYDNTSKAADRAFEAVNTLTGNTRAKVVTTLGKVFGDGKRTPQEIVGAFLDTENQSPEELKLTIGSANKFFAKLFVDNDRAYLMRLANVENPMSLIKINGRTPEELWGEKYNNLSAQEKNIYLQLEVLNAAFRTDCRITVDNFAINEENELVPGKPVVLVESARNFERTKDFLREVDNLHGMADSLKPELLNLGFASDNETAALYEEMKNAFNDLSGAADIKGTGGPRSLYDAWKRYSDSSNRFYTAKLDHIMQNDGTEADLRAVERQRMVVYNKLAEQFSHVVNMTRGIEDVITPGEYDNPELAQFKGIYKRLENQAKHKGLSTNRTLLHGEVAEPLADGFEWFNNVAVGDTEFVSREMMDRLWDKGILHDPNEANRVFVANAVNMLGRNVPEIIGEGKTVISFLHERGISERATFESYFLFYCMGKKGLSLEESLKLTHAHDKNPNGEFVNPELHENATRLENEFLGFLVDHPATWGPGKFTKEQAENAAKDWLTVFSGFAKKIKEYRFPDIDYSDYEQVEKHFDELYALSSLFGDGHQELDRIVKSATYNEHFDISRIGAEVMGSEEEYWKMRQFFGNMQGVIATGFKTAYVGDYTKGAAYPIDKLVQNLGYHAVAGDYMSTMAGKTIGEAYEENDFKVAFSVGESGRFKGIFTADGTTKFPAGLDEPVEVGMVMRFVLNQNKDELRAWISQHKPVLHEIYRKEKYPAENIKKQVDYLERKYPQGLKERLLAVDDNPQSMIDFMNTPVNENSSKTGSDAVQSEMALWLVPEDHEDFYKLGLKESGMFLIDGKSPEELWKAKYDRANVTDPVLRERLYRAEILKCMMKGDSVISIRSITMSNENIMSIGKPAIVRLPEAKMSKMFDAFSRYYLKKRDLISKLQFIDNRLKALKPKETTKFKEFRKAIRESCSKLKDVWIDYRQIGEKLIGLEAAAEAYYNEIKGSKNSAGKECAEFADELRDNSRVSENLYKERKEFDNDMMANGIATFAEANEHDVQNGMDSVGKCIGKLNVSLSSGGRYVIDAHVKERIQEELKKLRASDAYQKIMSQKGVTDNKLALRYLESYYDNLTKPELTGEPKKSLLTFDDLRGAERILKDVPALAENQIFTKYMADDPNKTIRVWKQVEAGAETLRTEYKNRLESFKNTAGSLDRYVAGLIAGERPNAGLEDIVAANLLEQKFENRIGKENFMYNRLAEVVWLQILAQDNKVSRQICQGINRNQNQYGAYINTIEKLLKDNHVLSTTGKAAKAVDQLENGTLRDDTLKILLSNALVAKKRNDEVSKDSVKQADIRFRNEHRALLADPENTLHHDTIYPIIEPVNGSLEKLHKAMDEYSWRGKKWKDKKIIYTENGEQKTVDVNQEAFVNVGFMSEFPRQNVFICYLMGKKNMSLEEAVALANKEKIVKNNGVIEVTNAEECNDLYKARAEFYQFVKSNPVERIPDINKQDPNAERKDPRQIAEESIQIAEESIRNWSELFIQSTEKMKEAQIPDIDYRDMNQVLTKLPLLTALGNIMTGVQENLATIFKGTNGVDGNRILCETAGGLDKVLELRQFWNCSGLPFINYYNGYCKFPYADENPEPGNERRVVCFAGSRYFASKSLQAVKGMTMKQAADFVAGSPQITYWRDTTTLTYMQGQGLWKIPADFADAAEYLTGLTTPSFVHKVEEYEKKEKLIQQKEGVHYITSNAVQNSLGRMDWSDEGKEVLRQLRTDDVQAMRDFLKKSALLTGDKISMKVDNQLISVPRLTKGSDYVASQISNFLLGDSMQMAAMSSLGIRPVDYVLIDGQTPTEKFKDKYRDIQDINEKEQLLQLEILCAIVKGENDVSFRTFAIENEKFVESDPKVAFPKRDENMLKVFDGVHSYKYHLDEIVKELHQDRTELIATQGADDRETNFFIKEDEFQVKEKGGDEYKAYTRALRILINLLEDKTAESPKNNEILEAFDNLISASRKYYSTHSSSLRRGLWSGSGRDRKKISRRMIDSVKKLKQKYMDARESFGTNQLTFKGDTFKDAPYADIQRVVGTYETKLDVAKQTDEHYKKNYKLTKFKNAYERFLKRPLTAAAERKNAYVNARNYILGLYNGVIAGTHELTDEMLKTPEELETYLDSLAKNPVFQNAMNRPADCIKDWHKVEKDAANEVASAMDARENLQRSYKGNYMALILGLPALSGNAPAYTDRQIEQKYLEIATANPQAEEEDEPEYLQRLNEQVSYVILDQILTGDSELAKKYSQAMYSQTHLGRGHVERDILLKDRIRNDIKKFISDSLLFVPGNHAQNIKRLNNGELAKFCTQILSQNQYINHYISSMNAEEVRTFRGKVLDAEEKTVQPTIHPVEVVNHLVDENRALIIHNPMAEVPEEQNNLLENPAPKFVPYVTKVIQPIVPVNGEIVIKQAEIPVQIPVGANLEIPPIQPIILPNANENVPKNEIIDNGIQQMQEENNNRMNVNIILPLAKPEEHPVQPVPIAVIEPKVEIKPQPAVVVQSKVEIKPQPAVVVQPKVDIKPQPKSQNINVINVINEEPKNNIIGSGDYVSDADMINVIQSLNKNTVMLHYPRNKWEFPLQNDKSSKIAKSRKTDKLKLYNTGDVKIIQGLINKNGALSATEKEYFKHHLASNTKLREMMKNADEHYANGRNPYPGGRLPIKTGKGKDIKESVEILLTKQDQFQTSEHGCWSCSAALLLQGRGIHGVTQEDIRLFRSADTFKTTPDFNDDAHKAYNFDRTSRIIEAGDLITRLAPDSMLRDLEIRERPNGSPLSPEEYKEKAVERLGKEIFKAINVDRSPVSLLRAGHYVTITGIRRRQNGQYEIKYKNSVHDERFAGQPNPDREVWENLSDAIGSTFDRDGGGVSISWMSDIKMDAQGHITNAPRNNVFVDKNGNLDVSKDAKFEEAEKMYKEERMQNGRLITKAGEDENNTLTIISDDGLSICEYAYVNNKLNFDYLYKRSGMSALEKEAENARARLKNYGKINEKDHPDEFFDKLRCIVVLATVSAVKHDKSIQGKDLNEKAENAYKKMRDKSHVDIWKKLAQNEKGEGIIKGMDSGELIGIKSGPVM